MTDLHGMYTKRLYNVVDGSIGLYRFKAHFGSKFQCERDPFLYSSYLSF
jgi:hypothetical protein